MQDLEYILAHGSGNTFVTIDAVKQPLNCDSLAEYVRSVAAKFESDGVLFLEQVTGVDGQKYYAMNMYNTDGTQAEMCGNGMRIIARLAYERYLRRDNFTLYSGGRAFNITRGECTSALLPDGSTELIPNYGVEIDIRKASADFTLNDSEFIDSKIEELHPSLTFTYLNLGNPHIVAKVDEIDLELLSELGERVKGLTNILPNGVNVSFLKSLKEGEIFVSTYERGVGLTASCGTAMTASSTTAALLGICKWGDRVVVRNRGGLVRCIPNNYNGALNTHLIGNATYIETGVISCDEEMNITNIVNYKFFNEITAWEESIKIEE